MLSKEDILQIAEIIATANGHPAPAGYAELVGFVFDRLNPPKLAGTPVLTDPTQWPKPDAPVANTDVAV